MSGTMSSASSDWLQFYQHSDQPPSKAEVGWTGKPATTITAANNTSTTSPPQTGRVSKPNPRRRSRASKRTPTTILSTDTTNFRAMVQQFTGGGQAAPRPFISTNESSNQFLGTTYSNNNSANLNFGLGPTSSMVAPLPPPPPPPAGAYSVQLRQPQDGGGGVDQHQHCYAPSSGNNTHAQHQAFLRTLQNYASAGPPRERSTNVGPTTQGEDDNYMF